MTPGLDEIVRSELSTVNSTIFWQGKMTGSDKYLFFDRNFHNINIYFVESCSSSTAINDYDI